VKESIGGDIPQTLPENVRSFCASKNPKLLTQQASPMLEKEKLKIADESLTWISQ
jgi:hypothetical protein